MRLAEALYETYAGHRRNVEGEDMPPWDELTDSQKGRFAAMAYRARRELNADPKPEDEEVRAEPRRFPCKTDTGW